MNNLIKANKSNDENTWPTFGFMVTLLFSSIGWIWQNDRVGAPTHAIIWEGTRKTVFPNYWSPVKLSSSSPSKQTCISLCLQEVKDIDLGGRYRQLCFSFNSGTVPIEHLLPLSPGTLRWISYINSALGLNTILTAFLFFHLLFFCEVGCSFFTPGMAIHFPKHFYSSYLHIVIRSVHVLFSSFYFIQLIMPGFWENICPPTSMNQTVLYSYSTKITGRDCSQWMWCSNQ